MNVLFLTLSNFDSPDKKGIYGELFHEFAKNGHRIYIVSPVERRYNENTQVIQGGRIEVLRVSTGNIQKTNIIEKGFSMIFLEKQYKAAIRKHFPDIRFDLIMYSTPPITLGGLIRYLKRLYKAKAYLLLKDIFPQNAVDLRMFPKKSLIYLYYRHKEKKLYKASDYIGCMSRANVNYLTEHNPYIHRDIIHVLPNSIEPNNMATANNESKSIRKQYGIPESAMVFMYGGNLGKPQNIPFIIKCLNKNGNRNNRYFIICGNGTGYEEMKRYTDNCEQSNVMLISELPKEEYDTLLKACDIGLIFLDHRFTIPNFPSRLLSYMDNSMPVFACTDTSTDIGQIILENDFGWWCESNDANRFTEIIDEICDMDISEKRGNARKCLEEQFTVQKAYEKIMAELSSVENT